MHLEEHGQGPSVVLLHGAPSSLDVFDPLVAALTKRYRVLVPHLPGYGKSPAPVPYTWANTQRELQSLLQRHTHGRAVLVGFSGGAYRAMHLALARHLDLAGLVLLAGSAQLDAVERDGLRQFAAALRSGLDTRPIAAPRFLSKRINDPEAIASVQSWITASSPSALAAELDAQATEPDLIDRLGVIECPVLLRVGAADQASPPAKSEAIAAKLANATVEVVPDVGHALLLEDEAGTVASVERFMRRCF